MTLAPTYARWCHIITPNISAPPASVLMDVPTTAPDALHEILKACIKHFSLLDVIRLCASSKRISNECTTHLLSGDAHQQLLRAVQDSATDTSTDSLNAGKGTAEEELSHRYVKAVEWLIRVIGSELLSQSTAASAATATAIFSTSCVPRAITLTLLRFGLSISYKQLVAAARQRVKGAEYWTAIAAQLDAQGILIDMSDVPSYVKDMCGCLLFRKELGVRPDEWSIPDDMLLEDITDVLYIATNGGHHKLSDPIVKDICSHPVAKQLAPEATLALFHHAARVEDWCAVACLCELPAAQHLDASMCADIVRSVIGEEDTLTLVRKSPVGSIKRAFPAMIALPGVQQLRKDVVLELVASAIHARKVMVVEFLCRVPAARQFSKDEVKRLIATGYKGQKWFDMGQAELVEALQCLSLPDASPAPVLENFARRAGMQRQMIELRMRTQVV